jgi:hypothetical protein
VFDVNGSGLAPLIIPIAGTLSLSAWLALVFHAGRRAQRPHGHLAPGRDNPGRARLGQVPVAARPQGDPVADFAEAADLRVIFEVER